MIYGKYISKNIIVMSKESPMTRKLSRKIKVLQRIGAPTSMSMSRDVTTMLCPPGVSMIFLDFLFILKT